MHADSPPSPSPQELFTSTVGPLRSASLAYDSKGKSKGVATIEFHKAQDASKAYDQYNKRLVDGSRSPSSCLLLLACFYRERVRWRVRRERR